MIRIRRAVPNDLPAILRIESECFASDAWSEEAFPPYCQDGILLVAAYGGATVGYRAALVRAARP